MEKVEARAVVVEVIQRIQKLLDRGLGEPLTLAALAQLQQAAALLNDIDRE